MRTIEQPTRISADRLRRFCTDIFIKLGVPQEDAWVTADVLVEANLRGVDSHGVARLRRYVDGLRNGVMVARPNVRVVQETAATALVDGGGGLGQPVSARAMKMALEKAASHGAGFVTVRNSNHYGIAGYYAMMALPQDMIGISMTNSDVLVVPTFGRNAMLGTNPISVAAPAGEERAFVLDMATSTVPRGKLEVYDRLGRKMPLGWATDEKGLATTDPTLVLQNMAGRRGGGLLPLGGEGETLGGHKGYGLALLVDVLAGVLSGAAYADTIYPRSPDGRPLPANVGHFFGALRVDAFRPLEQFRQDMDDLIRRLKNSPKAEGQSRIYIHGEKEFEAAEERGKSGIPLDPKTVGALRSLSGELDVPIAFEV